MTKLGTSDIPFVTYIDVEAAAKELGYLNLYANMAKRLSDRRKSNEYAAFRIGKANIPTGKKDMGKAAAKTDFSTLLKSASRSPNLLESAKKDYMFKAAASNAVDELNRSYRKLSSMYNGTRGLAQALATLPIPFVKKAKALIDTLKFNRNADMRIQPKELPLAEAINVFESTYEKYAKLNEQLEDTKEIAPELVKDMGREDRKKVRVGDKIKVIKAVRSGLGVVPAGETVTVTEMNTADSIVIGDKMVNGEEVEVHLPCSVLHRAGFTKEN